MAKKSKRVPSALEQAVDFLSLLYKGQEDQTTYCNIVDAHATAYNMIVGVGTAIGIEIDCCPHIGLLAESIRRCESGFALTRYSEDKLYIKQEDFHAFIPCLRNPAFLQWTEPDAPIAPLGAQFITAIDSVSPLADDKAETLINAAIQLYGNSVMATSGSLVMQAWHGFDMPDGMLFPKVAAKILHKIKKPLVAFGFSNISITFHFADNSWLKSQLYRDKLPDIRPHMDGADFTALRPIPHNFFDAVEQVAPFSKDGQVWVEGNRVSSHPFHIRDEGSGLTLSFDGQGHSCRVYRFIDLLAIRKVANAWSEFGREDATVFFGDNLRGMVWHKAATAEGQIYSAITDDDIPF